jgi:hypothetical protein
MMGSMEVLLKVVIRLLVAVLQVTSSLSLQVTTSLPTMLTERLAKGVHRLKQICWLLAASH